MLMSKTLAVLSLLLPQALGVDLALKEEAPIPGYAIVEPIWELNVFPGQPMNFTGTYEDAHHQATQINPRWEENYPKSLETRAGRPVWKNIVCGPQHGWLWITIDWVISAIDELRHWKKGFPIVAGKSCYKYDLYGGERDGQVWVCNDNPGELRLGGHLDVADGALLIYQKCTVGGTTLVGQQFAEGNWNVILRGNQRVLFH